MSLFCSLMADPPILYRDEYHYLPAEMPITGWATQTGFYRLVFVPHTYP